jgi:hypothetical protein
MGLVGLKRVVDNDQIGAAAGQNATRRRCKAEALPGRHKLLRGPPFARQSMMRFSGGTSQLPEHLLVEAN